jgi:hypothetical protein
MPATTPQAIVTNAITLLPGILWPGATPSTVMSNDGLIKLNDLLASWSTERLMVYGIAINDWDLVDGTNSYTIGAGGTFNGNRPLSIHAANIITPSLNLRYPLTILTTEQWNAIRDQSATSTVPTKLYIDGVYPLSTIYLWPTPNSSSTKLELHTWIQLTQFSTLEDDFDFPPGYERAITYNLALELANEYRVSAPPEVAMIAQASKATLKALNAPPTHIPGAGAEMMARAQIAEGGMPNAGAPAPPPGTAQQATS